MFRFTIRELLLLTLVVALGVGWVLRERQLSIELNENADWRLLAEALEQAVEEDGWKVRFLRGGVAVQSPKGHSRILEIDGPIY